MYKCRRLSVKIFNYSINSYILLLIYLYQSRFIWWIASDTERDVLIFRCGRRESLHQSSFLNDHFPDDNKNWTRNEKTKGNILNIHMFFSNVWGVEAVYCLQFQKLITDENSLHFWSKTWNFQKLKTKINFLFSIKIG